MSAPATAIAPAARTSLRCDGVQLDLRPSVACREWSLDGGTLLYLSLLDDEIDDRLQRFRSTSALASSRSGGPSLEEIVAAASSLELTDAVVVPRPQGGTVVVRGGSCTFPLYWREGSDRHLSTVLPLLEGGRFSRAGLAASVAAVSLHGSYEPNAWTATPLHAWHRIRRGTVTAFDPSGAVGETVIEDSPAADAMPLEDTILDRIREAFAAYARSQRHVSSSVLELSGGYDSTLAGAAARSPSHAMRGISVEFPYYEFRFEAPVQQAVAAALGIPRTVLDGTDLFPYAPWDRPPRFDEPSVFVTGIRHAERVAAFAQAQGAARIYVGHGGDQLFSTDLGRVEPIAHVPSRLAFPRETRRAIARTRQPQWRRRSTGCFVYDARPDVWVKETFGATIRTPFSDLALFRAAQLWSRWCAARQRQPDKTILARAEADLLPPAVTRRKGKVAYDGVWMRAYAVHAEHIGRTLERAATILEHLGLSPAWLLRRARCLAEWGPVSDREVLAAYAVAAWLVSWGLERVSDVGWV